MNVTPVSPQPVASTPSTPPAPTDLLDMLSTETPVRTKHKSPVNADGVLQAASSSYPPVTVYESHGIKGVFNFKKTTPESSDTEITATYSTTTSNTINEFSVQVAVPKFMTLKLSPASSNTLTPSQAITQKIEVTNSQHGQVRRSSFNGFITAHFCHLMVQKPLAMRLKVSGKVGGQVISEMAEVRNFPSGL